MQRWSGDNITGLSLCFVQDGGARNSGSQRRQLDLQLGIVQEYTVQEVLLLMGVGPSFCPTAVRHLPYKSNLCASHPIDLHTSRLWASTKVRTHSAADIVVT